MDVGTQHRGLGIADVEDAGDVLRTACRSSDLRILDLQVVSARTHDDDPVCGACTTATGDPGVLDRHVLGRHVDLTGDVEAVNDLTVPGCIDRTGLLECHTRGNAGVAL